MMESIETQIQEQQLNDQFGYRQIFSRWLPLFASLLFIHCEFPLAALIIARFPDPQNNLAAWGGVILPIAISLECAMYRFLTVSAAFSTSRRNIQILRKFFMLMGLGLTFCGGLLAFTSMFDWLVLKVMSADRRVLEISRFPIKLCLLWPWLVGYRGLCQGSLINAGKNHLVTWGSVIRLSSLVLVLFSLL